MSASALPADVRVQELRGHRERDQDHAEHKNAEAILVNQKRNSQEKNAENKNAEAISRTSISGPVAPTPLKRCKNKMKKRGKEKRGKKNRDSACIFFSTQSRL